MPTRLSEVRHEVRQAGTPKQQAAIGEYASLHGNQAAIHFPKTFGVGMKITSVQTLKGKYLAEVSRKRKADETSNLSVKPLAVKKRGRPLLFGEKLNIEVTGQSLFFVG